MKLGQLIECNMRNMFLEESFAKCSGETSSRPFAEKVKLSISNVLYSLFFLNGNFRAMEIY